MLVRDIGEFQLIDRLAQAITGENGRCLEQVGQRGFRVLLGIGDDAAAWEAPHGVRVMTTDTMVEGIHFNLDYVDWRDLGWKSLATNLSDIAAMGCAPTYSMVTLGLRGDLPVDGLVEMYQGMMDISREHGGAIVGGDIVRSPAFFLTVALEGTAVATRDGKAALLTRHTANPGDQVAVTGHLGCSGGGLHMLMSGHASKFPHDIASHLRDAHNRPVPRVRQGMALAGSGVMTAMDVSDGLADDLGKLCRASGVGARIHASRVPADCFLKQTYPDGWLDLALGGGEDYELLFTAPPDVMARVAQSLDAPVSIIGEIVSGEPRVEVLDRSGKPMTVSHGGWDHFRA